MASGGNYTTAYLARVTDAGVIKQVEARVWDLKMALNTDKAWNRPVSDYSEGKAKQLDRIIAEAEMRGLL